MANSKSDYENFIVRFELDIRDAEAGAVRMAQKLGQIDTAIGNNDRNLRAAQQSLLRFSGAQDTTTKTSKAQQAAMLGLNQQLYNQSQAYTRVSAAESIVAQRLKASEAAERSRLDSLVRTRYALYDISNALGIAGIAMVALATATYGASIAFERDFANVVRTSHVTGGAIDTLRKNFIELGQDIPITFAELSKIGTLGGQLGIGAADLTAFTSVVARFSATTNLSVDQAATAFGRLKALLPDVADGSVSLEALASSILAVGTNSVATEAEIAKIATQLSSMAGYAGLSADELVGLAGALASVGTQPELARGTITRLFTLFGRAVSDNGEKLAKFAQVAGVSADEFGSAFGTDKFGPIFLSFIQGLGNIDRAGGDVVATLNDLGISSVRDVPALTRLAIAADSAGVAGGLLAQTFGDAAEGIANASELSDQYAIIAGTVAAKLQVLQNNFNAFISSLGGGGAIFGGALDLLNGLLEILTEIAQNPVGSFFLQLGVVITGVVGLLAIMAALALRGVAGFLALETAIIGVNGAGLTARFTLAGLETQLIAVGLSAKVATAAVTALRLGIYGLIGLTAVALSGAIFAGITAGANLLTDALLQTSDATKDIANRLTDAGTFTSEGFLSFVTDVNKSLANVGLTTDVIARDLKTLDDSFAATVQNGDIATVNKLLEDLASKNGISVEQVLKKLPETTKQLQLQADVAGEGATVMNVLADSVDEVAEYQEALAETLGITTEALKAQNEGLQGNFGALVNLGTTLSTLQQASKDWAQAQADATDTSEDSWEDFYDGVSISLKAYNDLLEANLAATANWSANLLTLVAGGANPDAIAQLIALGPEKGAVLVQAAVDDIGGEGARLVELLGQTGADGATNFAQQFEDNQSLITAAFQQAGPEAAAALKNALINGSYADVQAIIAKYNLNLANNPLRITSSTTEAQQEVNRFLNRVAAARASVSIGTTGGAYGSVTRYAAAGGHIQGPGTETSDSIPARLSRNEYVIRAASVRKYGVGLFDQLNRGVARFATGGHVGATSSGSSFSTGVFELGPMSLGVLRRAVEREMSIYLDGAAVGRSVDNYNKNQQFTGAA